MDVAEVVTLKGGGFGVFVFNKFFVTDTDGVTRFRDEIYAIGLAKVWNDAAKAYMDKHNV
jgi:hypothetical protein